MFMAQWLVRSGALKGSRFVLFPAYTTNRILCRLVQSAPRGNVLALAACPSTTGPFRVPSGLEQRLQVSSATSWRRRQLQKQDYQVEAVNQLIAKSDAFLGKSSTPSHLWNRDLCWILNRWQHFLFRIPHTEKMTLEKCAACIDSLVLSFLNRSTNNLRLSGQFYDVGEDKGQLRPAAFVATGVYAWGRTAPTNNEAPVKAEAMVIRLFQIHNERNLEDSAPQSMQQLYSAMTYCWSQSWCHVEAPEKAHIWLNKILRHPKMQVQAPTYNAVLRKYAKQGKIEQVRRLVATMPLTKDVYTYQCIVEANLNSRQPTAFQEAYHALQQGLREGLKKKKKYPLSQLFESFLSLNRDNPRACEQILDQLLALQENFPSEGILQPRHVLIVMTAWATRGRPKEVERLFLLMHRLYYEVVYIRFRPTYQATLEALHHAQYLLGRIEKVLITDLDETVGNHGYNLILDAIARVDKLEERAIRAKEVISHMEKLASTYRNPRLLPDKISYTALMQSIVRDGKSDVIDQIHSLLNEMEGSVHEPARPDLKTYAIVLDAYRKYYDATILEHAETLLNRLKALSVEDPTVSPDKTIFTTMMRVYSNARNPIRAEALLSEMRESFNAGNLSCRPDEVAYRTAISSWGRSGRRESLDRAMRLLREMTKEYESGNIDCKPKSSTIVEVLMVASHSTGTGKFKIGQTLLSMMTNLGIEGDQRVWDSFIRVCAHSWPDDPLAREEALQAAVKVFELLRDTESNGADSAVYSSMLHVGESLIDDLELRQRFQRDVFSKCAMDGRVNLPFLYTLRRFLPSRSFHALTSLDPSAKLVIDLVPSSWIRHTE